MLVGVEGSHGVCGAVGIFGRLRGRRRNAEAGGADALVVGHDQRFIRRVESHRAGRIANRDQALDGGLSPRVVEIDNRDRIGVG